MLSSEEALQQARAKGLVLRLATRARRATSACVAIRGQDSQESGHTYQAQVWRGGKNVSLDAFANAEEAAL